MIYLQNMQLVQVPFIKGKGILFFSESETQITMYSGQNTVVLIANILIETTVWLRAFI